MKKKKNNNNNFLEIIIVFNLFYHQFWMTMSGNICFTLLSNSDDLGSILSFFKLVPLAFNPSNSARMSSLFSKGQFLMSKLSNLGRVLFLNYENPELPFKDNIFKLSNLLLTNETTFDSSVLITNYPWSALLYFLTALPRHCWTNYMTSINYWLLLCA